MPLLSLYSAYRTRKSTVRQLGNKKHSDGKGKEVKLSLFVDNVILYVENSRLHKNPTRTNQFSRVAKKLTRKYELHFCTPTMNNLKKK